MFSDFFFVRNKQERKKIFHMTINLCLVENKTRGMEPQWSPCKAFSLTDIETIVVWSVSFRSFDRGTERELERSYLPIVNMFWRFGVNIKGFACIKFLFSYTRQVLDGFVNYLLKRILILGEVFIQQDKWLDCITIVNWRELPILLNSNWNCQENIESVFVGGKKIKIHKSWFPKLCLHYFSQWFYFCQKWLGRGMNFSHASNWNCQENSESVHAKNSGELISKAVIADLSVRGCCVGV